MSNMYIKCISFYIFKNFLKKMCDFIYLLLKLNIYVLSSRFKKFRYLKNDISSFKKKSLKD